MALPAQQRRRHQLIGHNVLGQQHPRAGWPPPRHLRDRHSPVRPCRRPARARLRFARLRPERQRGGGQRDPERIAVPCFRPLAGSPGLATNLAAHQADQLLTDRQPQPGAGRNIALRPVQPRERAEQPRPCIRCDGRTVVPHRQPHRLVRSETRFRGQPDLAGTGVFHRVRQQLELHLAKPARIGQQGFRRAVGDRHVDRQAAQRRLGSEHLRRTFQQRTQLEQAGPDRQFAGLHLRQVQDIVDQAEQRITGLAGHRQQRLLRRSQHAVAQQPDRIQQRVQRGADFVADDGHETRLLVVRRLRRFPRLAQRLLGQLVLRDIGIQRDEPAIRQPVAPQFDRMPIRPLPLRHPERRDTQPIHPASHLGFRIGDPAELPGPDLRPEDFLHGQANPQNIGRNAGDLGEPGVPLDQAHMRIDHRHAVAHARQRRLKLLRLGDRERPSDLVLRVRGGQRRAALRDQYLPPAGQAGALDERQRQQYQQPRDQAGKQLGLLAEHRGRPHRLILAHRHDHREVPPRKVTKRVDPAHRVIGRGAGPAAALGVADRGEHRRVADTGVGVHRGRPDRTAQLSVVQSSQRHEGATAQVGVAEHIGDRRNPVIGIDHTGKRPVGMVQRARHVHVPLPHDPVDRRRADIQRIGRPVVRLIVRIRRRRQGAEIIQAGGVLVDRFVHR